MNVISVVSAIRSKIIFPPQLPSGGCKGGGSGGKIISFTVSRLKIGIQALVDVE